MHGVCLAPVHLPESPLTASICHLGKNVQSASLGVWGSMIPAYGLYTALARLSAGLRHRAQGNITLSHTHTHTAVKCHEVERFNVFIPCSHPVFAPNSTLCSQCSAFYFSTCSPTAWAELMLHALSTYSYWSARADFCFTSGHCSRQGCKVSEQYQSCNRWVFSLLWICQITDESFCL